MGYKKVEKTVSFAELSLLSSLKNNRSVKMMERIHKAVTWETIAVLLKEHYHIGQSHEGADAAAQFPYLACRLRPLPVMVAMGRSKEEEPKAPGKTVVFHWFRAPRPEQLS